MKATSTEIRSRTVDELAELKGLVGRVATRGRWLALCGSLTPGTAPGLFADLISSCVVPAAVDTSGEPLILALKAGVDLAKPNVHELAGAIGTRLETVGDVVGAAEQVRAWGCRTVVVSLGPDSAALVDDDGVALARLERPIAVASAVGAGDALLAAILAADRVDGMALARRVAAGAAACRLPGTTMPTSDQVDVVAVELIDDPDRRSTRPHRSSSWPKMSRRPRQLRSIQHCCWPSSASGAAK